MKWIKKICAKIAGFTKYLVHFGKVIQALKVVAAIMPQISLLLQDEKQQATLNSIGSALGTLTDKLEVTEHYLNDMGVVTTTEPLKRNPDEKLTLKRAQKMLEKISED